MALSNSDKYNLKLGLEKFCIDITKYCIKNKSIIDSSMLKGEIYTKLRRDFKFLTGGYKLSKFNIDYVAWNYGCIETIRFSVCYSQTASKSVIDDLNQLFEMVNWDDMYQKTQINLIINSVEEFKIK